MVDVELYDRHHTFLAFPRSERGRAWLVRSWPGVLRAGYAVLPFKTAGSLMIDAVQYEHLTVCVHPETASSISA
jgi:hypothetical protein